MGMRVRSRFTNYIVIASQMVALFAFFALSACHRNPYKYIDDVPKLPCKVQGACDAQIIRYMTKLNKRGIKVMTVGQDYMISIPASALFANQSPRIKWAAYGTLNDVADLLKQFRKIAINVTSYSSKYISAQREHSLTLARSRVVGEYLWSQGVDSRLVFTEGLGSDKPITTYTQGGDKSPNARVEITFRHAVI